MSQEQETIEPEIVDNIDDIKNKIIKILKKVRAKKFGLGYFLF
jgi:hypothetical protein